MLTCINNRHISKGDIVLILTGFSEKFGRPEYYEKYPEITEAFASQIIKLGVKIVGMDTPSPDRPPFLIHKLLLARNVLIIESLTNMEALLKHAQFNIIALPAKFDADMNPEIRTDE